MKSVKKILCVLLTLTIAASCVAIGSMQSSAVTDESAVAESQSGLAQETVQGSAILHCFCWSYNTIKQKLPEIAAAGYTAIQTSPVQPPKDYDASYTNTKDNWWKLYQPLDLAITDGTNYNSWLGTKAQFTQMCAAADNYGIKVIVDIVSNHLANNGTNDGSYNSLHSNVNSVFKNQQYFYVDSNGNSFGKTSSSSRYQMTHGHLGMPELNTSRQDVQQKVLDLMKECVDCGADGFRFDTAKHIELPTDDEQTRSDFWPTIINGINEYKDGLYIYGEILGDAYSKAINKNYVQYMDLTDDYTCYMARDAVRNRDANKLHASNYQKGIAADQAVLWAESHDTYMNDNGNSKDDTVDTIVKTWAMVNSRASATSLFFVRPGERNGNEWTGTMGEAGTDTWQSKPVVESNKFKNLFADKSEYLSYNSSYNAAYNERGTKGMVIVKTNGGGNVSLTVHKMADGTYRDHVTNTDFTVSNGTITGTVDSSGVAVIYNEGDTDDPHIIADKLYMKPEFQYWNLGNERYAMYLFNYKSNIWVDMSDPDGDGIYEGAVPSGKWTGVIFCRMNGATTVNNWDNKWNQTIDLLPTGTDNLFTVTEKDTTDTDKYNGSWSYFDGVLKKLSGTLYLDFHEKNTDWANYGYSCAYFYNKDIDNNYAWVPMNEIDGVTGYRKVDIPEGSWNNIIFVQFASDISSFDWSKEREYQTVDLTIPGTDSENNCFAFDGKSNDASRPKKTKTGNWTVYPTSHTHSYTPSWEWTDDYVKNTADAALTLSCGGENGCGRKVILKKFNNVPDSSYDEKYTFNASITFNDVTYTNTHYIFKRPTFEGNNAVLTDNIGLNFYVDCHQFDKETVGSLTFTQQKNSVRTETTKLTPAPDSTNTMYRAMFTVAAKEMGDTITATLTYGDNLTVSTEYTVADYLKGIYLNNYGEAEQNTKAKTAALQFLARSMLNYGSKAQTHFNYKTANLVDNGLPSYENMASADNVGYITYTDKKVGETGLTYAGSSMLLEDTITYRVFFKAADKNSLPKVKYNDETLINGEKGGYVYYDIKGIKAPELLKDRNLTIGDTTFTVNPGNYIHNSLNNNKNSNDLKNLIRSLYDYYAKAYAYFNLP